MLTIADTLKYYKRIDIEKELIRLAKDREVAVKYGEKGFGPRPDTLKYENDVLEVVRNRATSFHASEELWKNPMMLSKDMKQSELDELRIGWDLIIDIDCHFLEYSKIAANLIIEYLKKFGVKSYSCKFSGNKGFHIGIPFEAFPKKVQGVETRLMFPEAPRRIALYIKELMKEELGSRILSFEKNDFNKIISRVEKTAEEITFYVRDKFGTRIPKLNVEPFLHLDTILISPRHLFRMAYSLHEKSGLASIVIDPDKILEFKIEDAKPENVQIHKKLFLDKSSVEEEDAKILLIQALDFTKNIDLEKKETEYLKKEEEKEEKVEFIINSPITQEFFPPCINKILNGLEDGRKRSVLILLNYFSSLGWNYEDIRNLLLDWNKKNKEPLKENYIISQVKYHMKNKEKILPPNCDNINYYKDIGVCNPDHLCEKIKNPVNYSIIKLKAVRKEEKKVGKRKRKSEGKKKNK
ncbi:MAG: hypothetical protein QXU20_02110 [Candidatus Woesearchaeota archaeon]